jgi:hypothetical protein
MNDNRFLRDKAGFSIKCQLANAKIIDVPRERKK